MDPSKPNSEDPFPGDKLPFGNINPSPSSTLGKNSDSSTKNLFANPIKPAPPNPKPIEDASKGVTKDNESKPSFVPKTEPEFQFEKYFSDRENVESPDSCTPKPNPSGLNQGQKDPFEFLSAKKTTKMNEEAAQLKSGAGMVPTELREPANEAIVAVQKMVEKISLFNEYLAGWMDRVGYIDAPSTLDPWPYPIPYKPPLRYIYHLLGHLHQRQLLLKKQHDELGRITMPHVARMEADGIYDDFYSVYDEMQERIQEIGAEVALNKKTLTDFLFGFPVQAARAAYVKKTAADNLQKEKEFHAREEKRRQKIEAEELKLQRELESAERKLEMIEQAEREELARMEREDPEAFRKKQLQKREAEEMKRLALEFAPKGEMGKADLGSSSGGISTESETF
ncbi:hypothetical protein DFH27DRAFT_621948 [Peziza echinospora]|nr:hypothetical protein DFH27DRAFT_621948 [Peziza echinospora]